ncbi:MAG: hypothetical protein QM820_41150 [Minicystis sp.]
MTASRMTMGPSTRKPKSMAPSDIKSPVIPKRCMPRSATLMAAGMPSTTASAPRRLPRKSVSTTATTSTPSARLERTVEMVRPTKSARS